MTILSIAIPTFNGSAYILDTLDSIQNQLDDCKSKIEIVISDNASNDGTDILIKNYQRNSTVKIVYSKNSENLGFDKNVDFCIQKSSGKYVWLLGDDDLL
jgi:glycosyltransferase involved in cell wall biosynthesis